MSGGTEDARPEGTASAPGQTGITPTPGPSGASAPSEGKASPAVRFESKVEEIGNVEPLQAASQPSAEGRSKAEVTPDQIRDLAVSLKTSHLQGLRIANFAYEPVSLPASRVGSHEDGSQHASRQHTSSSAGGSSSPRLHARIPGVQSPPLTPSGTSHHEADAKAHVAETSGPRHGVITPQESTGQDTTAPVSVATTSNQQSSSDDTAASQRPATAPENQEQHLGDHRKTMFSVGPTKSGSGSAGGSRPVSREASPGATERTASQFYSRPITPAGDANDPYAAHKRTAPNKIEPRFMFSRFSKKKDISPTSSSISVHKSKDERRHSSFFGSGHHHKATKDEPSHQDGASSPNASSRQGSMSDLKRFFKLGPSHHHKIKRAVSPAASIRSRVSVSKTASTTQIPFADEHTLTAKYGKLGKVLGAGAGGSVRLMKRSEDNTVFAVKEFRPRHTYETEKEYVKKLTAEYCIGSSLHHGNIIETLDIIREKTKWYEVMEYAPFDLFAIVMTGKMSKPEVACCFLQILSGVTYLHSMGLAHRDLKLDNVVVSENGIMKIIDFGSAHVFKYPFENGVVMASGIVGSDPYLAPEVYDERKYDPTAVDIWSLAIIFCCMTLRRFPWKVPRLTDNSFKLFAADPTPGHDPKKLMLSRHKSPSDAPKKVEEITDKPHEKPEENASDKKDEKNGEAPTEKHAEKPEDKPAEKAAEKPAEKPAEKREVIKGPWRILRLLPRESRHVIAGMLEIDPKERIKMDEILKDPWVANTVICRQMGPGKVEKAENHTHILEPPSQPMK